MKKENNREKRTEKIMVCFTPSEYKAIAKKAIASHIKDSQAVRQLTLKGLGTIQQNLF
jgi:hypothetical protein